jgi:hypothetical protein
MLKDSYSEKKSLVGCVVPILVGTLGGAGFGYFYLKTAAGARGAEPLGMEYMGMIVGGMAGFFVGGFVGFLIDRLMTARMRREEEF